MLARLSLTLSTTLSMLKALIEKACLILSSGNLLAISSETEAEFGGFSSSCGLTRYGRIWKNHMHWEVLRQSCFEIVRLGQSAS